MRLSTSASGPRHTCSISRGPGRQVAITSHSAAKAEGDPRKKKLLYTILRALPWLNGDDINQLEPILHRTIGAALAETYYKFQTTPPPQVP